MVNHGLNEPKSRARELKSRVNTRAFITHRYGRAFDAKGRTNCIRSERHRNADRNPSFTADDQGRCHCWSQHCFGDNPTDIFGVIMEMESIGFGEAVRIVEQYCGVSPASTAKTNGSGEVVADYVYTDRHGEPVLLVKRIQLTDGSKTFAQFSPNGYGGWKAGTDGVKAPLYKLPEVTDGDDPVIVVEGEKCADALRIIGLNATTCAGGAGKFSQQHAEQLRGREVVVWPDKDEPGHQHADKVWGLSESHATPLRRVEPPDWLSEGGDVVDVLAACGEAEVRRLVDEAAELEASEQIGAQTPLYRWASDIETEEVRYVMQPQLVRGAVNMVDGDPGVGKDWLVGGIAADLSRGIRPGETRPTRDPVRSLLLCCEDSAEQTVAPRLAAMGADLMRIAVMSAHMDLSDPEGVARLDQIIEEVAPELVVISTLTTYCPSVDLFRPNIAGPIIARLGEVARRNDVAIAALRHLNKSKGTKTIYRGNSSIALIGTARSGMLVGRDSEDTNQRALIHYKCNVAEEAEPLGFRVEPTVDGRGKFEWTGPCSLTEADALGEPETDGGTNRSQVLELLQHMCGKERAMSADVIAQGESEGISTRTLQRHANRYCERQREGFGQGSIVYWKVKPEYANAP